MVDEGAKTEGIVQKSNCRLMTRRPPDGGHGKYYRHVVEKAGLRIAQHAGIQAEVWSWQILLQKSARQVVAAGVRFPAPFPLSPLPIRRASNVRRDPEEIERIISLSCTLPADVLRLPPCQVVQLPPRSGFRSPFFQWWRRRSFDCKSPIQPLGFSGITLVGWVPWRS